MIFLQKPRRLRLYWLLATTVAAVSLGCAGPSSPRLANGAASTADSRVAADSVSGYLREAYVHIRERRHGEAERLLLKANEINSRDPWVHLNLGVVYQRTGRLQLARRHYNQAIALSDTSDQTAVEASDSRMVSRTAGDIAQQNINSLSADSKIKQVEREERAADGASSVATAPVGNEPERRSATMAMAALAPPPGPSSVSETAKQPSPPVTTAVTSTPVALSEREGAMAAMMAWREAWQASDIEKYLKAYVTDFRGKEKSAEAWRSNRRRIISQAGKIVIKLGEPAVEVRSPDQVVLQMPFSYRSERFFDDGLKRLEMRRMAGRWLIVDEGFTPR